MTEKKTKILAIDYGTKRIGLAVSDPMGITAQPVGVLNRKGKKTDIPLIGKVIKEKEVERIVIGLPLNMNGSEGKLCGEVKKFGERLEREFGLPVVYQDERLTTAQAEKVLLMGDASRQKRRGVIDQMAAQLILQKYLATVR